MECFLYTLAIRAHLASITPSRLAPTFFTIILLAYLQPNVVLDYHSTHHPCLQISYINSSKDTLIPDIHVLAIAMKFNERTYVFRMGNVPGYSL